MDYSKIEPSIDVARLRESEITIVGVGGAAGLVKDLVRSGVGTVNIVDRDVVESSNLSRQDYAASDVGRPKAESLADELNRINPDFVVRLFVEDFTLMTDADVDSKFGDTDLFIYAADTHRVAARGNEVALRLGTPAMWLGVYEGGLGGEIVFWHDEIDACYRCICEKRYAAHESAAAGGRSLDPPSDGCTVFDVSIIDAIGGVIGIGLLTRGSPTRYGRVIEELGDRNLIQLQLDPQWSINGASPVRKLLGIAQDCHFFFAWNAIARPNMDFFCGPCPDCERFRGHMLMGFCHGVPLRWRKSRSELRQTEHDHG